MNEQPKQNSVNGPRRNKSNKDTAKNKVGPKGPSKWTEPLAIKLCDDLIAWMRDKPENILWEKFLVFEKGLYKEILSYLTGRFPIVAEKLEIAKKMQELKIIEGGLNKQLDRTISIFLLKTQHGYIETQHIQQNVNINKDDIPLFPNNTEE